MANLSSEAARLREVHRYYQRPADEPIPDTSVPTRTNVASTPVAIPDTALTAFLQLITWRLSKQRAIISLVDKDHQFFIAESTRTGNLVDPSSYEEAGDQLWQGCTGSTTRGEALCTNTIVAEDVPGGYPSFMVTDLPKDPRFADLPYVKGPPYFRYYAGTPLISKSGFRIGSLFVIDDRPHDRLSNDGLDFLGVMATNVMRYLELETESREQRRHMRMSKGLAALVEGKSRIPDDWNNSEPRETGTSPFHAKHIDENAPQASEGTLVPEADVNVKNATPEESSMLYRSVFARASNLLRESLAVDYSVFVDTSRDHGVGTGDDRLRVKVIGYSSGSQSTASDQGLEFSCSVEQKFLKSLCQQYHDGKIWSYHEDGSLDCYDDTPMSLSRDGEDPVDGHSKYSKRSKQESQILLKCFPGARQILFAPLWDSANGFSSPEYFSACFAVSLREVPVFTTEIEVAFVRAFVNSVGATLGHLAAALGEKQKSQFISSMSHELRSPLHGILASTELLYGTPLSAIQTDLCDTVDICGQTLLDTLSQILDYSKVNNFLRDTHNAKETERTQLHSGVSNTHDSITGIHAGSSLHVYSECDVAALCEEALDVISMSFRQTSTYGSPTVTPLTEFGSLAASQKSRKNTVVVDFTAPNENWMFLCSPGAIRRIVMNLVGNSFKYTENGSIRVKLSLENGGDDLKDGVITISVSDTGRGMSTDFMRRKLFVPFSQENTVAPGSGLGLSLVQGIVKSLDGRIDVWSDLGRGTKMDVCLPLKRATTQGLQVNGHLTPATASWIADKTYKFFSPETAIHKRLQESIRYYMNSWWHVKEVGSTEAADFIFLDSEDMPRLLELRSQQSFLHGIVLSQMASLAEVRSTKTSLFQTLEPLRVPFGPRKLFRALQACIKRSSDLKTRFTGIEDRPVQSRVAMAEKTNTSPDSQPTLPRPRLDPENRRKTAALEATALAIRDRPLKRQISQPVPQPKGGPTVLCVDDNAINLKLLNTFAKKLGFDNVESAEDGLQAFQAAEKYPRGFDVIFMDLTMPVLDGFESTRRIRRLEAQRERNGEIVRPSIIVALTGLASEEDQKKAFAAGVNHFVTKPLRFKDLKQMLSEWKLYESGKVDDPKDLSV
jgi:signal transduction histidine kinase/CheY-like chemotaxis protein